MLFLLSTFISLIDFSIPFKNLKIVEKLKPLFPILFIILSK